MTTNTDTRYFVVPAPGFYGGRSAVLSSHATVNMAYRHAGPGYVVREGSLRKGDEWLQVYEQTYPIA